MKKVYIVDGCRTPIGKTRGILREYLPEKLTALLLNDLLRKVNLKSEVIDEVILGNAVGPGGNIARLSLLEAGWETTIPGTTVDFQCGSGLKTINMAASTIMAGQGNLVIAGGLESTSMEPSKRYNFNDPRFQGEDFFYKRAQFSPQPLGDPSMLESAGNVAKLFKIQREEMDLWAYKSHQRAAKAYNEGRLKNIIVPVKYKSKVVTKDESIRDRMSLEILKRAKSVVGPHGSITSGNSCLTHDGSAIVLLASEYAVEKYNLKPIATITAMKSTGVNPNFSPLGPIEAVKKLIKKANISLDTIDAFEVNEAFAVKILAFIKELGISENKINQWGGALAYGHPYGASGALIMLHLIEILKHTKKKRGIAALGVAGGLGIATMIEREEE